jgi:hypothetical protein
MKIYLFSIFKLIEIFTVQLDMTQYETIVLKLEFETKSIGSIKEVRNILCFKSCTNANYTRSFAPREFDSSPYWLKKLGVGKVHHKGRNSH